MKSLLKLKKKDCSKVEKHGAGPNLLKKKFPYVFSSKKKLFYSWIRIHILMRIRIYEEK